MENNHAKSSSWVIAASALVLSVLSISSQASPADSKPVSSLIKQLASGDELSRSAVMSINSLATVLNEVDALTSKMRDGTELTEYEHTSIKQYLSYLERYSFYGKKPEEHHSAIISAFLNTLIQPRQWQNSMETKHLLTRNLHRWLTIIDSQHWDTEMTWLTNQLTSTLSSTHQAQGTEAHKRLQWETLFAHVTYLRWLKDHKREDNTKKFATLWPNYYKQLVAALGTQLGKESSQKNERWFSEHLSWLIAKSTLLLESAPDANTESAKDEDDIFTTIDKEMIALVSDKLSKDAINKFLTDFYLVPSFRTKESCDEPLWENYCDTADLAQVLPIKHECSSSLFIRAEQLSTKELEDSCKKLTSQESKFHQLFKTNNTPVANDDNDSLRVVVFDDWSQYHRYAPMLFDINTDNGGMYIEGTPSKPGNQATFFSFEAFWLRPSFKVWNLNHEYVHYLTGRFTTYGPFGHFPGRMVWWSEGVAEYIARENDNERATKTLLKASDDEIPSLLDVFNTEYGDGAERVYQWSYWAVRFLAEKYPEKLVSLKGDIYKDYFDGYSDQLDELGETLNTPFQQWLTEQKLTAANNKNADEVAQEKLPRKVNRYLYPNFLKPTFVEPNWLK